MKRETERERERKREREGKSEGERERSRVEGSGMYLEGLLFMVSFLGIHAYCTPEIVWRHRYVLDKGLSLPSPWTVLLIFPGV